VRSTRAVYLARASRFTLSDLRADARLGQGHWGRSRQDHVHGGAIAIGHPRGPHHDHDGQRFGAEWRMLRAADHVRGRWDGQRHHHLSVWVSRSCADPRTRKLRGSVHVLSASWRAALLRWLWVHLPGSRGSPRVIVVDRSRSLARTRTPPTSRLLPGRHPRPLRR
jgi:hypothetical protein